MEGGKKKACSPVQVFINQLLALFLDHASSTNLGVNLLGNVGWSRQKRGPGIGNGLAPTWTEALRCAADLNIVHRKLPVPLLGHI